MNPALQHSVRDNFIEKATYVARDSSTMHVVERASFVAVDCGLPSDTFNVVVVRDLRRPDQLLRAGVEYFRTRRLPMALWYWEDAADPVGLETLRGFGLPHTERHVAMAAEVAQTHVDAAPPDGLELRLAESAADRRAFGDVIAALFGASPEAPQVAAYYEQLSHAPADRFPALRLYLGLISGVPVATGTLFVGRETLGIYDIVTHDRYRRRGIGSAMFAHLLAEARAFPRRHVVLQASADGLGIYARAGFQPTGNVDTFENRALL